MRCVKSSFVRYIAIAALAWPIAAYAGSPVHALHIFQGAPGDGSISSAPLLADAAGNLYGTTLGGGAQGAGTAFKLAPDGTETVLYSFQGGKDGFNPEAGLIADAAGNLYGTTLIGGTGSGTVFKLAPDGMETVLYRFQGGNDGAIPYAGLIADSAGNLYGTTENGGGAHGYGTVFKLVPGGTETVLHSFQGGNDGKRPLAGLIADAAGNLYGTTSEGGAQGAGTVFKLAPDGTATVLHSFRGGDGANPYAGLIADAAGNLYGTTANGGSRSNRFDSARYSS